MPSTALIHELSTKLTDLAVEGHPVREVTLADLGLNLTGVVCANESYGAGVGARYRLLIYAAGEHYRDAPALVDEREVDRVVLP